MFGRLRRAIVKEASFRDSTERELQQYRRLRAHLRAHLRKRVPRFPKDPNAKGGPLSMLGRVVW